MYSNIRRHNAEWAADADFDLGLTKIYPLLTEFDEYVREKRFLHFVSSDLDLFYTTAWPNEWN